VCKETHPGSAVRAGTVKVNTSGLRVWLVEYNDPFGGAPKRADAIRAEVVKTLKKWFLQVVQHKEARGQQPQGAGPNVDVKWTDLKSDTRREWDIIVYFSPSHISPPPGMTDDKRVLTNAYVDDVKQVKKVSVTFEKNGREEKKTLRDILLDQSAEWAKKIEQQPVGGHTFFVSGVPALAEVFVEYTPDGDIYEDHLAVQAFHEAGHDKCEWNTMNEPKQTSNDIHNHGGGLVFDPFPFNVPRKRVPVPGPAGRGRYAKTMEVPLEPNAANIKFMAQHIWRAVPQYVLGEPPNFVP
jgi:hypothetical protein